jgi:hypothetical protein
MTIEEVFTKPAISQVVGTAPLEKIQLFTVFQTQAAYKEACEKANILYQEPIWDQNYPEKAWLDPVALREIQAGRLFTTFNYTVPDFENAREKQISLPAFIAGRVNIPTKEAANEVLPQLVGKGIPTPIRPLTENEEFVKGFGGILSVAQKNAIYTVLSQHEYQLLKEIHAMLKEIYNDKKDE